VAEDVQPAEFKRGQQEQKEHRRCDRELYGSGPASRTTVVSRNHPHIEPLILSVAGSLVAAFIP
jgi:hypothetical protein